MVWKGESLGVHYDDRRVAGQTFPPDDPGTLLSIGALLEVILTVAEASGLEPELELASTSGAFRGPGYARLRFPGDGKVLERASVSAQRARHTNRGPFGSATLPVPLTAELATASLAGARTWYTASVGARKAAARLIDRASRVRFQTREMHEWLVASLRFERSAVESGDGLDVRSLALPPGGAAFLRLIADWGRLRVLNRVGVHRLLAAIDARPVARGPGLLAILGPDDEGGALAAGRLLLRLWTRLNTKGVAVHPYYVVGDVLSRRRRGGVPARLTGLAAEVAAEAGALFGLGADETVHMMLRLGYPKKTSVRARRLPLSTLVSDGPAQG